MDTQIRSFPAVLNFTEEVAPLLAAHGIDPDTVMVPITIGKNYVRYQRLETTADGDRIVEDMHPCDGDDILIGIGIDLPDAMRHMVHVRFDAYGCAHVAIGCLVLDEILVVYPSQPTVEP